MNFCYNNYTTDPNVEQLYNILLDHGLTSVITTPTRVTRNSSSIIDQIVLHSSLLDCNTCIKRCGCVFTSISDHYLQYLELHTNFVQDVNSKISSQHLTN